MPRSLLSGIPRATWLWLELRGDELSAFERLGRGALLLDRQARVLQMNASVSFGDGLDLSNGCLHAPRPADRSRLQHIPGAPLIWEWPDNL